MKHPSESAYYPPGGLLIWIIVFLEFITFSAGIMVYLSFRQEDVSLFNESQQLLNSTYGMVNTIVLITSGLLMATTLGVLKAGKSKNAILYISLTIFLGLVFLVLKGFEYNEKFELGLTFGHNRFFMFYWLLTGFHFIHVLVGVLLLSYMLIKIKSGFYSGSNYEDVETTGVFWHMCDLIWIFLFPIIYLLH
jgi:nitric oxide reductase NorE protein